MEQKREFAAFLIDSFAHQIRMTSKQLVLLNR